MELLVGLKVIDSKLFVEGNKKTCSKKSRFFCEVDALLLSRDHTYECTV